MFKYKNITPSYGNSYVGGYLYKIVWIEDTYETYVCIMNTWTLGCCGARSLFQFEGFSNFWTAERVEEFFEFLDETDKDHYYSREVYFLLSAWQIQQMKFLVEDENTKKVDSFTNRGQGGEAPMTLYRWSSSMPDMEEDDEEDF